MNPRTPVLTALLALCAAAQDVRSPVEIPRPAEPERRAALGLPAPRPAQTVLAEIDELSGRMRPIAAQDELWKQHWREYRAMQRSRISLVSELEESGYDGERRDELLRTKLRDLEFASPQLTEWRRLRAEMVKQYAGTMVGAEARGYAKLADLQRMLRAGFRVHPDDYEKLAEVELGWRHHELAGILLLEALHREKDAALERRWHDWMLENLPEGSTGHRTVMRDRGFDRPIRLVGTGLDGGPIDTQNWRGDVILVDFWGMWCIPCRQAMPKLQDALDRHEDDGLRVVGVVCDHELDRVRTWLAEQGFTWPQFVDHSLDADNRMHPIAKRYSVGAFPTLWIIDRQGVLRERVTAEQLDAKLACDRIAAQLRERDFAHEVVHLAYEDVGHGIQKLLVPTAGVAHGASGRLLLGGEPAAHARAFRDSWPRVLAFLMSALAREAEPR